MKKALSFILALVITLMPMSALAAAGDAVAVPSMDYYIENGATVTVEAGATVFYEIGVGYDASAGFKVTGEGDFAVSVCTEDGAGAYLEGEAISAVDGVVESDIYGYSSTYGCCAFAITNNSDAAQEYTVELIFPLGTQSNPEAITLAIDVPVEVTVPAGTQYYIAATLPQMMVDYMLTITGETGFGYSTGMMPAWDVEGVCSATIAAYFGAAQFAIVNNTESEQTYTLTLGNMPFGAQSNPDTLPIDTTVTKELEGNEYWYMWTATGNGTLDFTIDTELSADGWTYNLQHGDIVYNFSTGWGEDDKNAQSLTVAEGDVIMLGISVPSYNAEYDYYDVYTPGNGTVVFTTAFTADGESGGEDPVDPPVEPQEGYEISETPLVVGTNDYTVSSDYVYTVYIFTPDAEGKYTFSSENSVLGIVSYQDMWVQFEPSADNVNANSFEWECTGVGQAIMVGVLADADAATITVEYEEVIKEEIQWTIYENVVTPEDFTFEGDADALLYVDTFDEIVDTAVLGEDGFYHLNSVDGPILYANLNDTLMSLASAYGYGQLKDIIYDEEGNVIAKVDYNTAFEAYMNCADADTYLYPLTVDLVEMFTKVGEEQGWYGEEGWVGGDLEDAWMFACYYSDAPEYVLGDADGNGELTATDYMIIKQLVFSMRSVEDLKDQETAALRCDMNGDGKYTAADYLIVKKAIFA